MEVVWLVEFDLPAHPIERHHGRRGEDGRRQGGEEQDPLGQGQGALLDLATLLSRFGPCPTSGFHGLRRRQSVRRQVPLNPFFLFTPDVYGEALFRCSGLPQHLIHLDWLPCGIIKRETVRVVAHH